jgi:hypothetical protein
MCSKLSIKMTNVNHQRVDFAIGWDTNGSCRKPAHWNGVFVFPAGIKALPSPPSSSLTHTPQWSYQKSIATTAMSVFGQR